MGRRFSFFERPGREPDPRTCNGCGVCMLSCPVWLQHHTQSLTYCGRNRAAIGGAGDVELLDSAAACILCGSCEALCPSGIKTQKATLSLRKKLAEEGLLPLSASSSAARSGQCPPGGSVLLPGAKLAARTSLLDRVLRLLNQSRTDAVRVMEGYEDAATDLESGRIGEEAITGLAAALGNSREIIVADGLLFNVLASSLDPGRRILSLGAALLSIERIRAALKPTDFYIIETRAYNGRRREAVLLYDELRNRTGCMMNLDLQRVATPTGGTAYRRLSGLAGAVSAESQVQWLLEGRAPERIVVEHLDDYAAFCRWTSLPVIHLAEAADA